MPPEEARNFEYLNRAGQWPDFSLDRLVLQSDGSLRLFPRAVVHDQPPDALFGLAASPAPAGVAVDELGNLFWSDPEGNRVLCRNACDGSIAPVACIGGSRTELGQLRTPRGLLIPANRQALFVVDSGNNRLQAFELDTFQLVEILPATAAGDVTSGAAPGKFNQPWSCAGDARGNLYVLDYGNQCVQKFLRTGDADTVFFANLRAARLLVTPVALAVTESGPSVRVCIADIGAAAVYFFDAEGNPERDSTGTVVSFPLDPAAQPMGMAATQDTLFLGDNNRKRILQFDLSAGNGFGSSVEVSGYQGPVSALTLVSPDTLYVYPGGGVTPLKIDVAIGFVPLGAAWSKQIDLGKPVKWHELIAEFEPLAEGAHLDVFAYASSDANDVPQVSEDPVLRTFFGDPRWQRNVRGTASDVTGMYIESSNPSQPKQRYLWVGVEFRSSGAASATLKNLRLEFNQNGYLPLLPAIYAAESGCGDFLPRLLALFQGFFEGVEAEIASLPQLFDPALTPKAFLDWLAGWMGVELDETWPEAKQRQAIAEAFAWFGRRGTRKGLEHSIWFYTGIAVVVEEPILQTEWWCLPGSEEACCEECASHAGAGGPDAFAEDSVLGWSTVLVPSEPNGAVVGRTAVLDQSKLTGDDEFGSPLFSNVAYQFSVLVPRSAVMCPEALAKLRRVIESQMPAHTSYHICILDPLMRVGFQSRVGIDTIVAGPPPSMRLGEDSSLGAAAVLGGTRPALLGQQTRIGITARVS